MTSTPQVFGRVTHGRLEPGRAIATPAWTDRRAFSATMIALATLYLLLENPYWVPGGDSEVYIAIAQNVARGNGMLFNGRPVGMVPPGWPLVMALVMKISPTFLALKLVTLASMLLALAAFYRVVRRFASMSATAAVVLLSGMLSHVYSLTFWLHSDALFCLLTALSILLALQIGEGRRQTWRIVAMLLLCALSVFVRWAGLLNVLLVAAGLLRGQLKPRLTREWMVAACAGLVIVLTFLGTRWAMKKFAPPRLAFENMPVTVDPAATLEEPGSTSVADAGAVEESYTISTVTASGGFVGYAARAAGWGTWFSFLLWQPLRLGAGWLAVWHAGNLLGWCVIVLLLISTWRDARSLDWLLPAAMLYSLALCINWTGATARYLVPVTPLILLGMFRGAAILQQTRLGERQRKAVHVAWLHCLTAIVLVNGLLYAADVSVMRSSDFYDRFEAGLTRPLIAAAQFLNSRRVGHGQVVVNPLYENIGRRRLSPTGLRGLTMLTGKALRTVPIEFQKKALPRDRDFRAWIGANYITYYLDQPPVSPWRLWHFRAGWLQELKTGEPAEDSGAGWRVYRCDGKSLPVRLPRPDPTEYPTRVPGL